MSTKTLVVHIRVIWARLAVALMGAEKRALSGRILNAMVIVFTRDS
jgi:hypothetical protein